MKKWVIETARLGLRRLQAEDIVQVRRMPWLNSDRVIQRSLEEYQTVGHAFLAVVLKATGEFAGVCGLLDQQIEDQREQEVGYHLIEAFHGQGLATEAARGVMDYAFDVLGLDRIVSFIEPHNLASARVAAKNGLVYEREAVFRDIPVRVFVADRAAVRAVVPAAVGAGKEFSPGGR